jgi:ABC-type multidrug transport system fused ATPase/permease subunit
MNHKPTTLVVRWLNFVQYILTIASSTYTLSQLMSRNAAKLILLSIVKIGITLYRLISHHCTFLSDESDQIAGTNYCRVTNDHWHRLNLMKSFSFNESLRRDIMVTGLEPWLLSEVTQANKNLGDTITKHPWTALASDNSSFFRYMAHNALKSLEYIWLIREGFGKGMSLGTLHLIRTSTTEIVSKLWSLSSTADSTTSDWKRLVSFYRCLDLKSSISLPENPVAYVSNDAGMKIEARNIRYRYDAKSKEVLKGISFTINPGEMIAVVGFFLVIFHLFVGSMERGNRL